MGAPQGSRASRPRGFVPATVRWLGTSSGAALSAPERRAPHPPQGLGPYGVGGATLPNTHTISAPLRGAPLQRFHEVGGAERRQSTSQYWFRG